MLEFMLDTNICIYVMRHREPKLMQRFINAQGTLSISSVVLCELYFGARNSRWSEESVGILESFAQQLTVLPLSAHVASHYAELRAALEEAGTPVGANDMLIGAHARSEGLTLVTNNRREFDRMPGLKVENWI
jgi:tRNA(fMet)-specific endonuclease VapC